VRRLPRDGVAARENDADIAAAIAFISNRIRGDCGSNFPRAKPPHLARTAIAHVTSRQWEAAMIGARFGTIVPAAAAPSRL
jgi:hypothetical protein